MSIEYLSEKLSYVVQAHEHYEMKRLCRVTIDTIKDFNVNLKRDQNS